MLDQRSKSLQSGTKFMSHLLLGHENVIKTGSSLLLKVILLTFRQINGGFDIAKPTQKGQKSSANQLYGSYVSQNFVRDI